MLGFIKKDLLIVKGNLKTFLLIFVFYAFLAYTGDVDITFILPFLSVMVMMSSFSYDAYNKWDSYALSIPKGRENIVKAKYLVTLILITITSLLVLFLFIFLSYIKKEPLDLDMVFSTFIGNIIGTVLVECVMYPIIFKWGIEKARIAIFALVIIFVVTLGFLISKVDTINLNLVFNYLFKYWYIFTILILLMSLALSIHIYRKKEF